MNYPEGNMTESQESIPTPERIQQLEQQVEKLTEENELLKKLAKTDVLTGLDNRRSFDEEIPRAISSALRQGKEVSLIICDVDGLKDINDDPALGHLAGDFTLVSIAGLLQHSLRRTDFIFRLGEKADEFVVILPATNKDGAIGVADTLRKKVNDLKIDFNDKRIPTRMSLGVSSFDPTTVDLPKQPSQEDIQLIVEKLVSQSDQAMSTAKKAGKNRVGFIVEDGKLAILEPDPNNHSKSVVVYR